MYKISIINSEGKQINVYSCENLYEDEIAYTLKNDNTTVSIPKSLFIIEIEKIE